MGYKRKDGWYQRAKREGYRSRAAYKLLELDRRLRLLRPGLRVVDLGCAPGGWLQVAAQRVGRRGRVVGIDRLATEPLGLEQVRLLQGDVTETEALERVRSELGGPAQLVLSDMAPDTSGVGFADHVRSLELAECAWRAAERLCTGLGRLVVKVFEGEDLQALEQRWRQQGGKLRRLRLKTSRPASRELYLAVDLPRDERA